jgi:hypothetical protein
MTYLQAWAGAGGIIGRGAERANAGRSGEDAILTVDRSDSIDNDNEMRVTFSRLFGLKYQ